MDNQNYSGWRICSRSGWRKRCQSKCKVTMFNLPAGNKGRASWSGRFRFDSPRSDTEIRSLISTLLYIAASGTRRRLGTVGASVDNIKYTLGPLLSSHLWQASWLNTNGPIPYVNRLVITGDAQAGQRGLYQYWSCMGKFKQNSMMEKRRNSHSQDCNRNTVLLT